MPPGARLARADAAARLLPLHPAGFDRARVALDTCALPPFCPQWLASALQACARAQPRLVAEMSKHLPHATPPAPAARWCGYGRGSWPLQTRRARRGERGDCQRRLIAPWCTPGAPGGREAALPGERRLPLRASWSLRGRSQAGDSEAQGAAGWPRLVLPASQGPLSSGEALATPHSRWRPLRGAIWPLRPTGWGTIQAWVCRT